MTTPNPKSASAAVVTLRAELEMLDRSDDAIDRKAGLLPVVVAAIAGIVVAPDSAFTCVQLYFLIPALISGAIAIILALLVLRAQLVSVGPNAQVTASNVHLPPADFDRAIAGSLADAVDVLSELTRRKAKRLNIAIGFGGVTILLLALVRVAGGFA